MKFLRRSNQLLIGGTASVSIALSLLLVGLKAPSTKAAIVQLAQGLSPEEINLRAKQIIVRIDGASVGSGSIVKYSNGVYTVLTNWHVVKNQGNYILQTIDGRKHQVNSASIKQLPNLDLAVLQFSSQQNYQTAEFGDSSNLTEGQNVYFAGYPGELRREDNRYYRFFTANLVGILPKSTENGYSLIYSGEAFPGMSGGPVLSQDGLMIGVHGEANINAVTGGTSNYGIPISSYQQAIAANPQLTDNVPETASSTPASSEQPKVSQTEQSSQTEENAATDPPVETSEQNPTPETESLDSGNVSSVPTFTPDPQQKPVQEPEPSVEQTETDESQAKPEASSENNANESEAIESETASSKQPESEPEPEVESEEIYVPTTSRKIALVSQKTGIDYTKLRNLLRDKKWTEADIYTYKLIDQVVQSAKQQNKHVFIELKTIAEFSCPDLRTVDYLWKKYSDNKFGFSPQQEVWQSVNQEGDFSTQTWRRFATKVGWKKGEVANGSGYLLYDELKFEPKQAPAGHLPWWFALPDEEQKVIKYLFARCNFNPTAAELEAEAKKNQNTANNQGQRTNNNQPNVNKKPKDTPSAN